MKSKDNMQQRILDGLKAGVLSAIQTYKQHNLNLVVADESKQVTEISPEEALKRLKN